MAFRGMKWGIITWNRNRGNKSKTRQKMISEDEKTKRKIKRLKEKAKRDYALEKNKLKNEEKINKVKEKLNKKYGIKTEKKENSKDINIDELRSLTNKLRAQNEYKRELDTYNQLYGTKKKNGFLKKFKEESLEPATINAGRDILERFMKRIGNQIVNSEEYQRNIRKTEAEILKTETESKQKIFNIKEKERKRKEQKQKERQQKKEQKKDQKQINEIKDIVKQEIEKQNKVKINNKPTSKSKDTVYKLVKDNSSKTSNQILYKMDENNWWVKKHMK